MNTARFRNAFTLVELLVVIGIIAVLVGLTLPAVQMVRGRAAAAACQNNLRQIGMALHQHHDARSALPPGVLTGPKEPQRFLTWQARILPWMEQSSAWDRAMKAFAEDKRFWSPPHFEIRRMEIAAYICPVENRRVGNPQPENVVAAFSHYLGVSGKTTTDGLLYANSRVRIGDIIDGTSFTLMVGERPPSTDERFGWWYAGVGQQLDGSADSHMSVLEVNRTFRAPTCPPGPYRFSRGNATNDCDMFHFWSLHAGGAHFLFADGSVRFLTYTGESIMPALATRAGQEVVEVQ